MLEVTESVKETEEFKFCFRLKAGSHRDHKRELDVEPVSGKDLFRTNQDMIKLEGPERWDLVGEEGQDPQTTIENLKAQIAILKGEAPPVDDLPPTENSDLDDLENLTIAGLKEMAGNLDPPVDLNGCEVKADFVSRVRSAIDSA